MRLKNILGFSLVAALSAVSAWQILPAASRFLAGEKKGLFPTVSGNNLDRQPLEFPKDFAGDLNILFIPFLRYHQSTVDTWVPFAQQMETRFPGTVYYELPTIDSRSALSRMLLNEGMRAGIPDPKSRERTITLYLDTTAFREALSIPTRNEVHTLLVNRNGEILWRTTGSFSEEKARELAKVIEAHQ